MITLETFLLNYAKDSQILGEQDALAIYEEIFSSIVNKPVHLKDVVELLDEADYWKEPNAISYNYESDAQKAINKQVMDKLRDNTPKLTDSGLETVAKELNNQISSSNPVQAAKAQAAAATASAIATAKDIGKTAAIDTGIDAPLNKLSTNLKSYMTGAKKTGWYRKLTTWFSGLKDKVSGFLGKLKGKSFSEILSKGMGWIKDPNNFPAIVGTTGGIVLLAIVIKALKKKNRLNRYPELEAYANGKIAASLKESFGEDSRQEIALNKVLEECKTNKRLAAIFTEEKDEEKTDYFGY